MTTTYNYTIATDTKNGVLNETTLQTTIEASAITIALDGIARLGDGTFDIRFKAPLPPAEKTLLDGDTKPPAAGSILGNHEGVGPAVEKKSPQGHQIIAPYAFAVSEEETKFKSYLYTAAAGVQSIFDEVITRQLWIQGGVYDVRGATEGDYAEFSVVDKDDVLGLFATYGLTVGVDVLEIRKYVETEYMFNGDNKDDLRVDAAGKLVRGLYFRCVYNSGGATDVKCKIRYLYYEG